MRTLLLAGAVLAALAPLARAGSPVQGVAQISGPMPTGVAVTATGRIFLTWPQWGDGSPFTLGELVDGKPVAWPDAATNRFDPADPQAHLMSVQAAVADGHGRLWALDTGAPMFRPPLAGAAKLVAYGLATGAAMRTIPFPANVLLPSTYVNDLRIDLRQGEAGVAYVTDSSITGPGGIIVVDLASGTALRRLSGHPSTMPDPGFTPVIGGEPLMSRPAEGPATPWLVASDGIAISADGATLYYCALSSRHLYAVPTALLRDPSVSEAEVQAAVRDLGLKGPSDGLSEDDAGNIYAGDYERNAIARRAPDGTWETLAEDPRLLWPDTMSVGPDGWLYVTANQLHRQAGFHGGTDERRQPYELLRIRIGAGPVVLK
ncbi:L-dopachrome tautomerase-related protein [Oceanicella sp. SM1341]|uniref:L-dopachrome tautomerase-related protein n=1 Tax=Oceanicella sp. SM1341 TaxID=1548889 RepID=UPI0018E52932|nr:L-dopachrome tautomerase-related protein [Oceanicella sp. SM1341]